MQGAGIKKIPSFIGYECTTELVTSGHNVHAILYLSAISQPHCMSLIPKFP